MNASVARGEGSAWDDPATQSFLRGKRIAARVMTVNVVIFAVIAITLGVIQTSKADRLAKNGAHTRGVILWVHNEDCGNSKGPIVIDAAVRFNVDGESVTHTFNTSCGRGLFNGAVVPIDYDPKNPADFAVAGFASDNPAFALVDLLGGIIAFPSAILAVGFTVERHNRKQILRQTSWVPTPLLFVRSAPTGRGAPSYATVLNTQTGQEVFRGNDPNNRVIVKQPLQTLELAGEDGPRRALRRHGGNRILFVSSRMSNKVKQQIWRDWQSHTSH